MGIPASRAGNRCANGYGRRGKPPLVYVFNTCTELIRTLPAAPRDEHIPDDIDTEFEDHALDETRYATIFKKREIFFGSSHG